MRGAFAVIALIVTLSVAGCGATSALRVPDSHAPITLATPVASAESSLSVGTRLAYSTYRTVVDSSHIEWVGWVDARDERVGGDGPVFHVQYDDEGKRELAVWSSTHPNDRVVVLIRGRLLFNGPMSGPNTNGALGVSGVDQQAIQEVLVQEARRSQ